MKRLRVVPIVEGHGEVEAVRILIDRVWRGLLGGEYVDVLRPIRRPRSKLLPRATPSGPCVPNETEIGRAVELAAKKLADRPPDMPALTLLLLDADAECPKDLAPQLAAATRAAGRRPVAVVLAKVEYETWFVAAAESLGDVITLRDDERVPESPEEQRCGKHWIQQRMTGVKYSETVDQPRFTARMDLNQCRARSPSFDKLCRELARYQGRHT